MTTLWGFPVNTLFHYVLQFYQQEKERLCLDYIQRIELLALFKQVKLGPYTPEKDTDTGYFDVVGYDRRKAWKGLGTITQEESQTRIIQLLEGVCPQLKESILNSLKEVGKQHAESSDLIKEKPEGKQNEEANDQVRTLDSKDAIISSVPQQHGALAPAAVWCSPKSARNFIAQVLSSTHLNSSGVPVTLAPGEVVTVQVPTSTQASAIFWEFVTEEGDIGFGLSFQRSEGIQGSLEKLLPVTLMDCSEDLVLGNHQYQDEGMYLLHFSNTHSTHPKALYYRVFYQNTSQ